MAENGDDRQEGSHGCEHGCDHHHVHVAAPEDKKKRKKKTRGAGEEEANGGGGEAIDGITGQMERLGTAGVAAGDGDDRLTNQTLYRMLQMEHYQDRVRQAQQMAEARGLTQGKDFKFWSTQPVLKLDEQTEEHGPIDAVKSPADVRQEPYKLPEGFTWSDVDIKVPEQLDEVYELLNKNYVEDDDAMFRFDYSREFLMWALTPPGSRKEHVVGIRVAKGSKLVGFITGVPVHMRVYDSKMPMVEINFLCVLKKLRSKRLAPVLIKEITRRVNLTNVWQAVYTAGVVLPKPVARCRYHHRLLNPKKLIEINFTRLAPRMTLARTIKLYKLPDATSSGLRPMTMADVPSARRLLEEYLTRFQLAAMLSDDEFAHWLLPRPRVVDSFVVVDSSGNVTDMCSFYHLPSTVIGNDKHPKLYAVYSFYNVATTMSLKGLMQEALVLAKLQDIDVFNALDIMENNTFLQELKFGQGDGHLQYYLYNWKCPQMEPSAVGMVLL